MRSILTSSHAHQPAKLAPGQSIFMVSSRDRIRQRSFLISSKPIARTPPPAFLFPFNNVKDPNRSTGPPFSARSGESGYLAAPNFVSTSSFQNQLAIFRPADAADETSALLFAVNQPHLRSQSVRRYLPNQLGGALLLQTAIPSTRISEEIPTRRLTPSPAKGARSKDHPTPCQPPSFEGPPTDPKPGIRRQKTAKGRRGATLPGPERFDWKRGN
jgi:hypothetical protein